jgi:4-hydroxy-4-methyl-2-oxoglutarate aldolase
MSLFSLEPEQLEKLRQFNSSSVANAIETFGVRLRNTGFTDSTVHCVFADYQPMVGYAATVRVRTSDPPMEGECYFYRLDWLNHILSIPAPRVLVVQDIDRHPGLGSFVGDVHANILAALGCVGVVTNGAVRNLHEIQKLRFQMYAGNLSVSHAYAHVLDFGTPVEVAHMQIRPGDLLHGDRHGVQTVPLDLAQKIPAVAQEMMEQEREIIQLCHSKEFSVERLRADVAALGIKRKATRA